MKKQKILFLAADILLIAFSVWLAFLLRFDGNIPPEFYFTIKKTTVLTLIFSIPIFYFLNLYSFSWSYVSAKELVYLLAASVFSFLLSAGYLLLSNSLSGFPRSTLFIAYFLIFIFAGGTRFSKRIYFQLFKKKERGKERILIIGAGDAGEQVLRNIQNFSSTPYFPVGFIDDDPSKKGNYIHGIKVFGGIDDMGKIIIANNINGTMIAFPSAATPIIKKAVGESRRAGIRNIKILPPLSELVNGQVSLADIKDFKIEDLLEKNPILYDPVAIKSFLEDKIVLITGAAGSIGSEISRQIAKLNISQLCLLDQDETGIFNIEKELKISWPNSRILSIIADIQDEEKIQMVFNKLRPQIVFHAAAYKHVPLMEKEPEEAVKNNIFGAETVAKAALTSGAEKFVFISTDKAVNPSSVMGATKRIGEMICQNLNQNGRTKFVSVRFGNVLGSRGSVILTFKEQIRRGGPIEVTHEKMERYFMIIPEAVSLVLQASQIGNGGEVFVLDMGDPVKILDLAKELIKLSGLEPDKDIPIVFSSPRPGEKFSENILTAEEGVAATKNSKIFIAHSPTIDGIKLEEELQKLKAFIRQNNQSEIINSLKNLVPFYNK